MESRNRASFPETARDASAPATRRRRPAVDPPGSPRPRLLQPARSSVKATANAIARRRRPHRRKHVATYRQADSADARPRQDRLDDLITAEVADPERMRWVVQVDRRGPLGRDAGLPRQDGLTDLSFGLNDDGMPEGAGHRPGHPMKPSMSLALTDGPQFGSQRPPIRQTSNGSRWAIGMRWAFLRSRPSRSATITRRTTL